jgi:hypothetical protein
VARPRSHRGTLRSDAILTAALAVLAAILAAAFFRTAPQTLAEGKSDLRLYLGAARILAGSHPGLLYDWPEQQRQQQDWPGPPSPYANPPFVALLFVPLLPLPPLAALIATMLVETMALAAAMVCAARLAGLRAWPLLALAALAQPWALQIWLAVQPAPLMTLLWTGFALAWLRGRDDWAAGCVAAGMAIKPHLMLPLVVFLLFAGQPRAILVLITGAALLALGAWALIGVRGLEHYPQMVAMLGGSAHWTVNPKAMVNLRGLLARTLGDTALSRGLALGSSLAVTVGIAWAGWVLRGLTPRPRRLEGNRLGELTEVEAATEARAGCYPQTLSSVVAPNALEAASGEVTPPKIEARGANVSLDALRATSAIAALAGTMLASYHMHVQELPGLFVLAALCVPAGWLSRDGLVSVAIYLVAGLWILWVFQAATLNVPPLFLIVLFLFSLDRLRCARRFG